MITMTSALVRTEKLFGERIAIVDIEKKFTWQEHIKRISMIAGALLQIGIKKGDRFGIIGPNSFRYQELIYAGYWYGAIPVPINHRLAAPEILHILNDANIKYIALGEEHLNLTDNALLAPWSNRRIV